ncbi:MAG: LNS2 domain-containing protein [Nocardioidaceae bacterium]
MTAARPADQPGDQPVAVIDLDGVLADVRHRLHHLQRRPKDWHAFFSAATTDPVLPEGRAVVEYLAADHEIVYLSGRPQRWHQDTLAWLQRHQLPLGRLLLRPDEDRRPARAFKLDRLRVLAAERTVAVLVDDDRAVCEQARRQGFTVFQATWAEPDEALFEAQEYDGLA